MMRDRIPGVPFARGMLCGVLIVAALKWFIDVSPIADWIVQPLLVKESPLPVDAIVVPGAGVIGDCLPNHHAERRVLRAVRLWRQHAAPFVFFLGGAESGACPASEAMSRFAVEIGMPESSVRVESASRSTWENAAYAAPMLRGWGIRRLALVTDQLHMRRAAAVFEHHGFKVAPVSIPVFEGHEDNSSMLKAGLREYLALGYYRLLGRSSSRGIAGENPRAALPTRERVAGTGPIVVLGASYAQGWPLAAVGDIPVLNRGIAGQQSADLLGRFERDVLIHRPRAVVIWGFINDIYRAQPNQMNIAVARIQRCYEEMVALARQHGIEPILATELTIRPSGSSAMNAIGALMGAVRGKPSYQEAINQQVSETNSWLVRLAQRERLLVLDFQGVLAEDGRGRRRQFAQPDGSHVSRMGYDALTQYATPIVQGFLIAG